MENLVSITVKLDSLEILTLEVPFVKGADIFTGITLSLKGHDLEADKPANTDYVWASSVPIVIPQEA